MPPTFRIRTITAGFDPGDSFEPSRLDGAASFLRRARDAFTREGHEVQTLRLAGRPLASYLPGWADAEGRATLRRLDRWAAEAGFVVGLGPVELAGSTPGELARSAARLIRETATLSFSLPVADAAGRVDRRAVQAAGETIAAVARVGSGGEGNFRFAATALAPAGTPFFPAAWFDRPRTFALGLESAGLVTRAFAAAAGPEEGERRLQSELATVLAPLEERARALASAAGWSFLGTDVSPAPGLDASIGEAIEALTGEPFGAPSTAGAVAAITAALGSLPAATCGYSGVMLPVLEDRVLARRAAEGRYGIAELLLFSTLCGTGLDVVPLPGDTPPEALSRLVEDVATVATTLRKPLSARLLPIPGRRAGDPVTFDNPYLTDSVALPLPGTPRQPAG